MKQTNMEQTNMKQTDQYYKVKDSNIIGYPTGWPKHIGKKSNPVDFGYYPLWKNKPNKPGPYYSETASDPIIDEDNKRVVIFYTWIDATPQEKRKQILQIAEDQVPDYSHKDLILYPNNKTELDKAVGQWQNLKKALDTTDNNSLDTFDTNIDSYGES